MNILSIEKLVSCLTNMCSSIVMLPLLLWNFFSEYAICLLCDEQIWCNAFSRLFHKAWLLQSILHAIKSRTLQFVSFCFELLKEPCFVSWSKACHKQGWEFIAFTIFGAITQFLPIWNFHAIFIFFHFLAHFLEIIFCTL